MKLSAKIPCRAAIVSVVATLCGTASVASAADAR